MPTARLRRPSHRSPEGRTVSRLQEKVALITGATGGIGTAIVARFREEGARLLLTGTRSDPSGLPRDAVYVPGDILDEEHVARLIATARSAFGRLDVLVNGHGLQFDSDITATELDDAKRVMDVNVLGPFLTMKHGIPLMLEGGGGSVVNIASRLGIVGIAEQAIYSASKGGLIMLSRGAAIDYAARGVRVNVVAPGLTATEVIEAGFRRKPDPEGYRQAREATIPMKRLATPAEVAAAVLFMASDEASFITGVVLPVDGGYTAA
jgi:NAD(P)-dependent dehydrogenase (short-subunit alcohol dehydrogenase family)